MMAWMTWPHPPDADQLPVPMSTPGSTGLLHQRRVHQGLGHVAT